MDIFEMQKKKLAVAISAAVIASLGLYLTAYAPLIRKLNESYSECKSAEARAIERRNIVKAARGAGEDKILTDEEDISRAIDELTAHGRLKGVNFVSISPGRIKKDVRCKIVPVDVDLESTYEKLGAFLGSLDELGRLFKVKDFSVAPHKEDASMLMTSLTVDIYLSEKENAE